MPRSMRRAVGHCAIDWPRPVVAKKSLKKSPVRYGDMVKKKLNKEDAFECGTVAVHSYCLNAFLIEVDYVLS